MKATLLALLLVLGCSDPFGEAKTLNTVEAYDKFIAENSSSSRVFDARMAIEKLMTDKARETQDPADFDLYIKKFKGEPPTKSLYSKMVEERQDAVWNKASESNSVEDWKDFIKQYKTKSPKAVNTARKRLQVAEYLPNLKIDPIEKTQINLSGDPNGPLDGWEFSTTITNNGKKSIDILKLRLSFLNAEGEIVEAKDFTVIGCGDYCQRMFVFDDPSYNKNDPDIGRIKPPFKGNSSRDFSKTTGDIPPDWSKQLKADFTRISFTNAKKK
jgi:hypothetical protein